MKFWIGVAAVFVVSFGAVGAYRMPAPVPDRPVEAAMSNGPIEGLSSSDDFARYGTIFATAARELIRRGMCTEADFKELGGFVSSQNHKGQGMYFTYCGGMTTTANRIYVKVEGNNYSISR